MKLYIQRIHPAAKLPAYAYEGDAGMDLFSVEDMTIAPGEKVLVATGLKLAVPPGHGGFVWDKSGIATKHHIKTMAGVVDSNYRGELKVALTNLGAESYEVKSGEKLAQLVIKPVATPEIEEVEEIEANDVRGEKGFGSSGMV
ncbi:MAG: dUTP diphosphatase [Candidatus Spechtbacterales bacterium]